jgi:hypothetical protein
MKFFSVGRLRLNSEGRSVNFYFLDFIFLRKDFALEGGSLEASTVPKIGDGSAASRPA